MAKLTVQRDAHRLMRGPKVADAQVRVIGQRRARADHDRVMAHPQRMDLAPRLWAGDPAAFARCRGNPAVQRCRKLQRDEGQAARDTLEKPRVEAAGLARQHSFGHGNTGLTQHPVALARHARVRVGQRSDNACDLRCDQRFGARGRPAVVGARFQRDIGRCPGGQRPGLLQGPHFGMGPPARLGPAPPHNQTVLYQDAANRRVWPGVAKAPRRQAQGMGHMAGIFRLGGHSSPAAPGRSSDTKPSKSSAVWKFL